jgi:hypothetical protein
MSNKKIIADYLHSLANRIDLGEAIVIKVDESAQGTYRELSIEWSEEKKNE